MEKEGKCCFCGKQFTNYGNDIRPLVNASGDRCCDECNTNIVIPNRFKFWFNDVTYAYVIYVPELNSYLKDEKVDEFIWTDKVYEAMMFKDEMEVCDYIYEHYKKDIWTYKKLLIREDN